MRPPLYLRTACFSTGGFTSFSNASHCFCLTLPTGNIWKLTLLTCLFVQPIDAHDFNIFLFDTSFNTNFEETGGVLGEEHCSLWFTAQRAGAGSGNATHWVTADGNWRTWLLAGAARGCAGWWQYAKFSPRGITEGKRRTASYSWSVLLSYKLICMWGLSSPLQNAFELMSFWAGLT